MHLANILQISSFVDKIVNLATCMMLFKSSVTLSDVEMVLLREAPVTRAVCRWCFAAVPAAPDAAAWLSPAGAAGLCSCRRSPSTEDNHQTKVCTLLSHCMLKSSK